jgi:hypothetical protein
VIERDKYLGYRREVLEFCFTRCCCFVRERKREMRRALAEFSELD